MHSNGPFISLSPGEVRRLAGGSHAGDAALELAADTFLAGDEVWAIVESWALEIARHAEQFESGTAS